MGLDAQCEQAVKSAQPKCAEDGMSAMKACFAKRLSPKCAAQANAPPSTRRDPACEEEFKTVMAPCGAELTAGTERCLATKVDARCYAQYSTAMRKFEEQRSRCEAEMGPRMARMQRCLKMEEPGQKQCLEALKAEKSSCNF